MATLLEMTSNIVAAQAQKTPMTVDEVVSALQKVNLALQALEAGTPLAAAEEAVKSESPALTLKQAFKTNEVVCMICGKGGMKTLTRHLNQAHQMKPSQYRKEFNIPQTQPLMSKSYSAKRKEIASTMDLGGNLEKARAARKVNLAKAKGKKK